MDDQCGSLFSRHHFPYTDIHSFSSKISQSCDQESASFFRLALVNHNPTALACVTSAGLSCHNAKELSPIFKYSQVNKNRNLVDFGT